MLVIVNYGTCLPVCLSAFGSGYCVSMYLYWLCKLWPELEPVQVAAMIRYQ